MLDFTSELLSATALSTHGATRGRHIARAPLRQRMRQGPETGCRKMGRATQAAAMVIAVSSTLTLLLGKTELSQKEIQQVSSALFHSNISES